MNASNFLMGGAAFGVIAGFWGSIKAILWRILNLFLQDAELYGEWANSSVVGYLVKNYRLVGFYDRRYRTHYEYIRTRRRYGYVAVESYGNKPLLFVRGSQLIFYTPTAKKASNTDNGSQVTGNSPGGSDIKLGYLIAPRWMVDLDLIMKEAIDDYNDITWACDSRMYASQKRFTVRNVPDFDDKKGDLNGVNGWPTRWQFFGDSRLLGHMKEDIGIGDDGNERWLDRLFFPDDITKLIDEIRRWRDSENLYKEIGVPWKRGWLLHGRGGTGKSALAAAFAHDLDMPLFIFSLADLSNLQFMRAWRKMLSSLPAIALIEDIDNVFHGRKNITRSGMDFGRYFSRLTSDRKAEAKPAGSGDSSEKDPEEDEFNQAYGGSLNFDVLLNCLDGVERCEGLFTIITTNRVEHIDSALGQPVVLEDGTTDFRSTRPGRIDRAIHLDVLQPEVKKRMACHLLRRFPAQLAAVLAEIDHHDVDETPAQFQDRCAKLAINAFWAEQEGGIISAEFREGKTA